MDKMDRLERARIFQPFDALKGLHEALRIKEFELERIKSYDIDEDTLSKISSILINLESTDIVKVKYLDDGMFKYIKGNCKIYIDKMIIKINKESIYFDQIYDMDLVNGEG